MNKKDWRDLARALGELRKEVEESWPPKHGYRTNAPDVHDRRLIRSAKLAAIDAAAKRVCLVLKGKSRRFDGHTFMQIVTGNT